MKLKRVLEQHIAVFGESGSGKTVLLSSFYGATQEPAFLRSSLFDVTADDVGQGHRLHANYLGMKDSARPPSTTRFSATSYAFSVKVRNDGGNVKSPSPFDAMRLVWHDYPGDWFHEEVSDPELADRRVATFRSLLGSDVAFLLIDGQRLLDNAGEEERYLKSVLSSFRTGLLRLKDELLEGGEPLVRFPRIWVLALSKADLLPEVDVFGFRDLLISKAADDLAELRKVLEGMVASPEALAVGEDFVLLSSAKFEPGRIEVTERIGLDLLLPLAAVLPLERHVKWIEQKQLPAKVAAELLDGVGELAVTLLTRVTKVAALRKALEKVIGREIIDAQIAKMIDTTVDQLRKSYADAMQQQNYMQAVLTQFLIDLKDGEEERVLLRSKK